ncbi:MAG: hypothetical protein WD894_01295 [Pirellulales bacterium]
MPRIAAILLLVLALFVGQASAQEDASKEDASKNAEFQRWLDYYQEVANAYDIYLSSEPKTRLEVTPKPIMSYSHPAAMRGTHGAFFVWTRRGRPEVVGSIWSDEIPGGMRTVMHEFHSLSLEPLSPVQIGRFTWAPQSGIEIKPIPDAPAPKGSAPLRLAQLRALADQFTGYSTPHGEELRLRTLRQPLYRYESKLPEVLDGAVFGMFKEWDPELILLIEARKTSEGMQWHYGVGRFNTTPVRLTYKEVDVWKGEQTPQAYPSFGDPKGNFFAVHQVDRQDTVNPRLTRK